MLTVDQGGSSADQGGEEGPGLIAVSWVLCHCPAALAAQERVGGPAGHMAVFCNAAPRCRSVWYRPRHEAAAFPSSGR